MIAVTFDYGQTLAELDVDFLSRRVAERGGDAAPARLTEAMAAGWRAYDDAKREGRQGKDGWAAFMRTLLSCAGAAEGGALESLVDFLWQQQPEHNLWRKPIPGMFELCADLAHRGVPVGIVSNSEGHLADLVDELGISNLFRVVADSGQLGFEKPDARIFMLAAERLGVSTTEIVHVGDAWEADVQGALGVSARAVWITAGTPSRALPEGVLAAFGSAAVRSALREFGVPA
jgi:putative hydrolase of the HAD superfamily